MTTFKQKHIPKLTKSAVFLLIALPASSLLNASGTPVFDPANLSQSISDYIDYIGHNVKVTAENEFNRQLESIQLQLGIATDQAVQQAKINSQGSTNEAIFNLKMQQESAPLGLICNTAVLTPTDILPTDATATEYEKAFDVCTDFNIKNEVSKFLTPPEPVASNIELDQYKKDRELDLIQASGFEIDGNGQPIVGGVDVGYNDKTLQAASADNLMIMDDAQATHSPEQVEQVGVFIELIAPRFPNVIASTQAATGAQRKVQQQNVFQSDTLFARRSYIRLHALQMPTTEQPLTASKIGEHKNFARALRDLDGTAQSTAIASSESSSTLELRKQVLMLAKKIDLQVINYRRSLFSEELSARLLLRKVRNK